MSYKLRYSNIAAANLPKLPGEVVAQIRVALATLAEDPATCSRHAVCPPFVPFGHQCDIPCRDDSGNRYNVVVFFVYSDCGDYLDIHRMQVQYIHHRPVPDPAEYTERLEMPDDFKAFEIPNRTDR